ncbi:hypothetical protein [Erythrobacter neustonensis]|uniref:Uncharacterized protein n=1 Tax=Erythrobacter neustonensis TaxID=1112 RepID=A0A192D2N9_9SPHN|nr:hypothetical protein [Erythrobacter neustonensis]ANK12202.1 hypothetical protein A9D12_03765 [Erythrobacter neustonensis]
MELLVQTAGSLVAILALAGLAWWMKLGGSAALDSEEAVRRAAGETLDGFDPVESAFDGKAAITRDAQGRIMVIKRHGNRFAGRVLGPQATAGVWQDPGHRALRIDSGERRFGVVFLDIPAPETWVEAVNRVKTRADA